MKDYLRQTTLIAGVTLLICGFSSCGKHEVVPDIQPEERSPAPVLECNYPGSQNSAHVWSNPRGAMEYVRCHCLDAGAGR